MNRHCFAIVYLLAIIATAGVGCQPCNRTGMSISAQAKQTTITAPPGGGGRSFVEITGTSFSPNVPITISFRDIPSTDPNRTTNTGSTTTNSSGAFRWTIDISALGPLNFTTDPNVDVSITAKETNGGCFALQTIKAGSLLHPPLK